MKKILAMLLILVIAQFAFAQSNESDDGINETQSGNFTDDMDDDSSTDDLDSEDDADDMQDLALMQTGLGAQMRLLQLERSIQRNILMGALVVDVLNESNSNATELNRILDEMQLLLEDMDNLDLNATPEDLAKEFVLIKKESKNLTHEFKTISNDLLTNEQKQQIRLRLRTEEKDRLKDIDESIKEKRHLLNAEHAARVLSQLGIDDAEILEKIRNGEMTSQDLRLEIKDAFRNMTDEEKREAVLKVREDTVKKKIQLRSIRDKVEDKLVERLQDRSESRQEKLKKLSEELREAGFEKRAEHATKKSQRIDDRIQDRIEDRDERNISQDRSEDRSEQEGRRSELQEDDDRRGGRR